MTKDIETGEKINRAIGVLHQRRNIRKRTALSSMFSVSRNVHGARVIWKMITAYEK